MPTTSARDATLRAHRTTLRAALAAATRAEQEATPDDAFRVCRHDPTREEWHTYACAYLHAGRRVAAGGDHAGIWGGCRCR